MVRVHSGFRGTELVVGAWLLAAATLAACAGKALDVGSEEQKGVGGSGAGPRANNSGSGGAWRNQPTTLSPEELAGAQWPADTPCVASPGSAKVGTWKGHWPDVLGGPESEVVVRIKGLTEDGVPCGTVTIGNGPAPPPVTDADAIYPPSQGTGGASPISGYVGPGFTQPWPGYEYRMLNVRSSESRLAFGIAYLEILRPWCQLQTAVEGSFSCLPEWTAGSGDYTPEGPHCTISGPNLAPTAVPCFKMQYCSSSVCFCYDGACDLTPQQMPFELHWDGRALEGSVNGTQLIFLDPVP